MKKTLAINEGLECANSVIFVVPHMTSLSQKRASSQRQIPINAVISTSDDSVFFV